MGWRDKAKWYVRNVTPAGRVTFYVYDKFGNVIAKKVPDIPTTEEIENALAAGVDAGLLAGSQLIDELQDLGAELIDDIKDVSLEVASAALEIVQGAGLAALSGAELMFDYTYSKISPHRVEAVSVMTATLVYLTTAVIVFKKIKGAN
jgi:YD repeat-containing protein